MKNTNNRSGSVSAETTKETVEKDTISQSLKKAFDQSIDYNWSFHRAPDENECSIVALDPKGWQPILAKTDKFLAEHICKTHNDWLNFKQKSEEKKIKKVNLRRLKNLAWRMKTFRDAFKLIEKNNYLGFDSIKTWIKQNEDDVNQWIFTKWLKNSSKNSSNYEEWTWFFHNQGNFIHNIAPNEYSKICDCCQFIDYFRFGNDRSMNGVPEGEWDSYTFHQEYENKLFTNKKLFADEKCFAATLILEKMFYFAEEYVKHNGWITGEMADKYHIDLKLVETNSDSDVLLDKMDPVTANLVRKIVEESDNKFFEKNPELEGGEINFKKPLEKRVDNLEKMIKDIWTNICADKSPTEVKDTLPTEIINKKPVLERRNCPHCKNGKDGCEYYDKGTCRATCYLTYPPQWDPCVFD